MLERVVAPKLDGGACPHLAVLLKTADELHPVLASFYALGAKRDGWMAHRSIAGEAELDRDESRYEGVVAFEVAWDQAFKDKPGVTLCPYVVGDLSGSGAIERMQGVSEFHDGVLVPNRDAGYTLLAPER